MLWLIGRTAEDGSRTPVHAAAGAGEETHGRYLDACRVKNEGSWARSDEARPVQREVWTELKALLEEVQPGITKLQWVGTAAGIDRGQEHLTASSVHADWSADLGRIEQVRLRKLGRPAIKRCV